MAKIKSDKLHWLVRELVVRCRPGPHNIHFTTKNWSRFRLFYLRIRSGSNIQPGVSGRCAKIRAKNLLYPRNAERDLLTLLEG